MCRSRAASLVLAVVLVSAAGCARPRATPRLTDSRVYELRDRFVGCYELRWIPDSIPLAYSDASVVDKDRISLLRLGAAPYGQRVGKPALGVEEAPRRRRTYAHLFWTPRTDSTFQVTWNDHTLFGGVRVELTVLQDSVRGAQYTFSDIGGDRDRWTVRGVRTPCPP